MFRRIQMVRPAGASFVVLSSGRSMAEPLGRCDQFFGLKLYHMSDAGLSILRLVVVRCMTAPLHLQRVCSGISSSGCKARMLGNGCPQLPQRLIRHRIDHTHRLPGDTPQGAVINPCIMPIRQFCG